jgi:uncharacterized protein YbcI
MAAPSEGPLAGQPLLDAITGGLVELHVRYFGRAPAHAHSRMIDDEVLAVLMGDVYTEVEKTMIELQRESDVHETRSAFQHATERRFISLVERLSGRRVQTFISTHHVGPDLELELFILDPVTAEAQ